MAKPKIKLKSSKKTVSRLVPILIKTISNVYKTIHINPKNKFKYSSKGKFLKDKRKSYYSKKRSYYEKENIPEKLRRIKKKDPKEYRRLRNFKDEKNYHQFDDEYERYLESKAERKKVSKERKKAKGEAQEEELKRKKRKAKKKLREEEKERELAQPVRVWAKVRYRGDNPIFIEAFIDGRAKDEASLRAELLEFVMSNFNEDVGSLAEVGIEKVSRIFKTTPELKYKSSLTGGWNNL